MIHVAYNVGPASSCYILEFHYAEPHRNEVRYWNSALYSIPYHVEQEKHLMESLPFSDLARRFGALKSIR